MGNRRQRFTITYVSRTGATEEVQTLAYPRVYTPGDVDHPGWAVGFPAPMVGRVLSLLDAAEIVKIVLTPRGGAPSPVAPRWRIDPDALDAAKDFFGLKLPVYVRRSAGYRTQGTHRLMPGWRAPAGVSGSTSSYYHHLTITGKSSADDASRTIWHELTHCWQAERAMAEARERGASVAEQARAWSTADERSRAIPYSDRPCEVEARSYEDFASEIAPAVVPA